MIQAPWLTTLVEFTNTGFTAIFFIEMLLKLIAYGPIKYAGDSYNLFDGAVVFIRFARICIWLSRRWLYLSRILLCIFM